MTFPAIGGGSGGNGFIVGPADNIFGSTSGTVSSIPLTVLPAANRAAAESVRDAYATGHASWLAEYDANNGIGIYLYFSSGGDEVLVAQVRVGGEWRDSVAATAIPGVPGPAGDSLRYSFAGVADRDAYYATAGNRAGLTDGVSISVTDNGIVFTQVWTGATNPAAYDPNLFIVASIGTSPGSLYLGEGGQRISGGFNVINVEAPGGKMSFLQGIEFTNLGTFAPYYYKLGPIQTFVIADVFSTALDPSLYPMTFGTGPISTYATVFTIRPATSGKMRVQSFFGATTAGPRILDVYYDIPPSAIGATFGIAITNPTMKLATDTTTLLFSGVSLYGGTQTLAPFAGMTTPYLTSGVHIATPTDYVTADLQYLQDVFANRGIQINKTDPRNPQIRWNPGVPSLRTIDITIDDANQDLYFGSSVIFENSSGTSIATIVNSELPIGYFLNIGHYNNSATGNAQIVVSGGTIAGLSGFTLPTNTTWGIVKISASAWAFTCAYQSPGRVVTDIGAPATNTIRVFKLDGTFADVPLTIARANWTQTNPSASDYIENKPTLPTSTSQLINNSLVSSVSAGAGISVDNTNPRIPIVSALFPFGVGAPLQDGDICAYDANEAVFTNASAVGASISRRQSIGQSVAGGTNTVMVFDTVDLPQGIKAASAGITYSAGTFTNTSARAAKFFISAQCVWDSGGTGERYMWCRVNGANGRRLGYTSAQASTGNVTPISISVEVVLAPGEYVNIMCSQNTGINRTLNSGGSGGVDAGYAGRVSVTRVTY